MQPLALEPTARPHGEEERAPSVVPRHNLDYAVGRGHVSLWNDADTWHSRPTIKLYSRRHAQTPIFATQLPQQQSLWSSQAKRPAPPSACRRALRRGAQPNTARPSAAQPSPTQHHTAQRSASRGCRECQRCHASTSVDSGACPPSWHQQPHGGRRPHLRAARNLVALRGVAACRPALSVAWARAPPPSRAVARCAYTSRDSPCTCKTRAVPILNLVGVLRVKQGGWARNGGAALVWRRRRSQGSPHCCCSRGACLGEGRPAVRPRAAPRDTWGPYGWQQMAARTCRLKGSACQVPRSANSDACPRPTTAEWQRRSRPRVPCGSGMGRVLPAGQAVQALPLTKVSAGQITAPKVLRE
jgi:hypothetical protein